MSPDLAQNTIILLVFIVAAVIVFLVTREFWCWYFKINQRIKLMEEILRELKRSNSRPASPSASPTPTTEAGWKCPKCGHVNPNYTFECQECGFGLK